MVDTPHSLHHRRRSAQARVTMDRLSCTYSWRTVLGAVDVAAGDGLADRGRRHRVLVPSRRDRQIAFIEELGARRLNALDVQESSRSSSRRRKVFGIVLVSTIG